MQEIHMGKSEFKAQRTLIALPEDPNRCIYTTHFKHSLEIWLRRIELAAVKLKGMLPTTMNQILS